MQYYRINKTQEDHDLYFSNNGLFNFWNEYLILHWNDAHIIIINRPGTKFTRDEQLTIFEIYNALDHVKDDYCSDCKDNMCDIVKDFGECVLPKVKHDLEICRETLFSTGMAQWYTNESIIGG